MSRDWKRLRTPSLTVVGNAGAGELRRVATEIERFRLALGAFAPAMRLDSPLPTTVVVFSDDRAFMPFKPRERGRPMPFVAGYFSPLPEEHRIVMSGTGRREFTFYVIFHEYTHLLVNQNVRRLPLWLHEGLAEFYSTFSGSEQDGRHDHRAADRMAGCDTGGVDAAAAGQTHVAGGPGRAVARSDRHRPLLRDGAGR